MNTPTPAQALGEVLKRLDKHELQDTLGDGQAAIAFLRQHGQHFAGLEAHAAQFQEMYESAVLKYSDATDKYISAIESSRAWREQAEAAEARVREADGLLRGAVTVFNLMRENGGGKLLDYVTTNRGTLVSVATAVDGAAAFLGARG